MFEAVFKDMLKYLPAMVVPAIVGFLSIPIFTRLFSPQAYGNYSIVMATVMVMSTILGWLPMGVIRFYPAYKKEKRLHSFETSVFCSNLVSILALLAISSVVLLTTKAFLSPQLFSLLFIGLGILAVTSQFNILLDLLRSQRKAGSYSLFTSIKSIGGLGFALILISSFRKDIAFLLWGTILSTSLILPFMWRRAIESVRVFPFIIEPGLIKTIAKYSLPLVIGNLAAWILSLSDRYVINLYRGAHEVGIYSASYDIADKSIMLMISLFTLVVGPLAFNIWEKEGETESKIFSTSIARYFLIIYFPAVTGLVVLSKTIISLCTADQYQSGYIILPLVVSGVFLFGLQQHFQRGLLFHKQTSLIMWSVVISGFFNLLINFIYIPRYGYIAAAYSTFLSYGIYFVLIVILSRRFYTWHFPFQTLLRVFVASVIMGIAVYYLNDSLHGPMILNLFLVIFLGILIYFVMLFLFREYDLFLIYKEFSAYIKDRFLNGDTNDAV
jgi:O-antigen/teichoic acid export membrane protein